MLENMTNIFYKKYIEIKNPKNTIYFIENEPISPVNLDISIGEEEIQNTYIFSQIWYQYLPIENYQPISPDTLFSYLPDTNPDNYTFEVFKPVTIDFDTTTFIFSGYFVLMLNRTVNSFN